MSGKYLHGWFQVFTNDIKTDPLSEYGGLVCLVPQEDVCLFETLRGSSVGLRP